MTANARSFPSLPASVPLNDNTIVPVAIRTLPTASLPGDTTWRAFAELSEGVFLANTRHVDHSAPRMMTSAGTPDPTAARIRGATPKTSLPVGNWSATISVFIGAMSTMPVARPERATSEVCTMSPTRRPTRRWMVPSASHATLSTAPVRKKRRKTPMDQPALSAHHSANEPMEKSAIATVQARSWGWPRRNHRSAVLRANAHATSAAAPASAEFTPFCAARATDVMEADTSWSS